MNLLPERSLLAVATVVDIALNARTAPVAAKVLSARHGLMPRHLETLLQELVRAGIIKGTRGPRGGYELARERRRVTVGEVVRAAAKIGDSDAKPRPRPAFVDIAVTPVLRPAADAYLAELDRITLAELCDRAESRGARRDAGLDFAI